MRVQLHCKFTTLILVPKADHLKDFSYMTGDGGLTCGTCPGNNLHKHPHDNIPPPPFT